MMMSDADRLQKLEELCAHQSSELDTLSDIVRDQGTEIDLLKQALLRFRDRLTEVEDAGTGPHINTKPPHY